jgi:tetratricopeptide (TPR) repeat protein
MAEDSGWQLIGIDEKTARRQGIPTQIPIPNKEELKAIAEKGLELDQVRKWISSFLSIAPSSWRTQNAPMAARYDAFIAKVDFWKKAQGAFEKNDYKAAIGALKMICNVDKEDHAARMNLASALANSGDHKGALEQFEKVRATYEGVAEYHVALGQVHIAMQNTEAAIGEMVLALEAQPDNKGALESLKALGVLVGIYENPRDASSLMYVRSDSIEPYLVSVWDAAPRDAAYYLEQLAYHGSEKRHSVVLAAAERGLALPEVAGEEKKREGLEMARAGALRALGRLDDALAAIRAFVEKSPRSTSGHVELARCLATAQKLDDANAEVDKALEIDPGDLMALSLKFASEDPEDIAKVQKTIAPLTAFAEAHAESAGVWRALARAKLATGASEEALALFAKAVGLASTDDDLRAEYWGELGRQRKFDEVIADANKIADLAKRDWKLRWNEAEAYAATGKLMEARGAFTAINMDESLHVDIRKRAKRAVQSLGNPAP